MSIVNTASFVMQQFQVANRSSNNPIVRFLRWVFSPLRRLFSRSDYRPSRQTVRNRDITGANPIGRDRIAVTPYDDEESIYRPVTDNTGMDNFWGTGHDTVTPTIWDTPFPTEVEEVPSVFDNWQQPAEVCEPPSQSDNSNVVPDSSTPVCAPVPAQEIYTSPSTSDSSSSYDSGISSSGWD